MLATGKAKSFLIGVCLILLAVIVVCGEEATPAPTATPAATAIPVATPTPTPTPVAEVEPVRPYAFFYGAERGFNMGFEHPWFQQKLAGIRPVVDDDARWAIEAKIARWIFDNS